MHEEEKNEPADKVQQGACGNQDECCETGGCNHNHEGPVNAGPDAGPDVDPEQKKLQEELKSVMEDLNSHCLKTLVEKLHFPKTVPCPECEFVRKAVGEDGNQADTDSVSEALSCESCGGTGKVSPGYPIVVSTIRSSGRLFSSRPGIKAGEAVSIRPCSGNPTNRTYLGFYVAEAPRGIGIGYDKNTGILNIEPTDRTPAFVVPEIGKIVFGSDSWWEKCQNGAVKPISDKDIEEVWYVKAMRENWTKDQISEYLQKSPGEKNDLIDYLKGVAQQAENQDNETESQAADTISGSEVQG